MTEKNIENIISHLDKNVKCTYTKQEFNWSGHDEAKLKFDMVFNHFKEATFEFFLERCEWNGNDKCKAILYGKMLNCNNDQERKYHYHFDKNKIILMENL